MSKGTLKSAFSAVCNITRETLGSWLFLLSSKRGKNAHSIKYKEDENGVKAVKSIRRKTSIRGVFLAATMTLFGHPLLGKSFQTGEDFLKDRGIDPAIATMLSDDTTIRVRDRNLVGALHSLTDLPTIIGAGFGGFLYGSKHNAYMTKGWIGQHEILFNNGMVTLPYSDVSARERISAFTDIPEDLIENVPITDEEFYNFIVFHEFRHADDDNTILPEPLVEAEADAYAMAASLEVDKNPAIVDVITSSRAMHDIASSHNTGMFLDALRRGEQPRHHAFMQGSTVIVFGLAQDYIIKSDPRPDFVKLTEALVSVLEDFSDELSSSDKRRAELYIESAQYFAPSSVAPVLKNTRFEKTPPKEELKITDYQSALPRITS